VTRTQQGSALIETVLVGLLLMVPLIWLLGVLADMHRGALASTAAAREAGADAARATSVTEAERAIDAAIAQAFRDHGLDPASAQVSWSAPRGFERGAAVEIEITYPVTMLQAPFLGSVAGPSVDVSARHAARIDPFRSRL
jgi:hypothetical protein